MNRLPAVLQKEIWEYVRGDRAHWKFQFRACLIELWYNPRYRMLHDRFKWIKTRKRHIKMIWQHRIVIAKRKNGKWSIWTVFHVDDRNQKTVGPKFAYQKFNSVYKEYQKRILQYAKDASRDPHFSVELAARMRRIVLFNIYPL
jgi:hypothetical protein